MDFHPYANLFPLIDGAEFDALVADVAAHGVREPVWLYEGKILDGRNRYCAAQVAGVECPMRTYDGDSPLQFVVSLNLHRRHLSESQRSMVADKLANLPHGGDRVSEQGANLRFGAVTQAEAAEMLNVSRRNVQHARVVREQGVPELARSVESGAVSVSAARDVATLPQEQQAEIVARGETEILQAAKEIRAKRAEEVRAKQEALRRESIALPLPQGQYRTIVIDPPWPMEIIDRDVRPGQVGMHYPVMSIDEIKAFPIPAGDDAIVYMWTTQRFLRDSFDVLEAWGFKYLVTMVWHKPGGPQPFNLPQYNCEFILVGRRGSLPFMDTKQFFTCFEAPRREHSRKPDEFYELVRRVSPGPRIDIFSREPRPGFDQFGNETSKFAA